MHFEDSRSKSYLNEGGLRMIVVVVRQFVVLMEVVLILSTWLVVYMNPGLLIPRSLHGLCGLGTNPESRQAVAVCQV